MMFVLFLSIPLPVNSEIGKVKFRVIIWKTIWIIRNSELNCSSKNRRLIGPDLASGEQRYLIMAKRNFMPRMRAVKRMRLKMSFDKLESFKRCGRSTSNADIQITDLLDSKEKMSDWSKLCSIVKKSFNC